MSPSLFLMIGALLFLLNSDRRQLTEYDYNISHLEYWYNTYFRSGDLTGRDKQLRSQGLGKNPVESFYQKGIENFVFFEKLKHARKQKLGEKKKPNKVDYSGVFFE